MPPSNFEIFITAYQNADKDLQNFIDSDNIGMFVESLISKASIARDLKPQMLIIISNLCLGIIKKDELGMNLIQIGIAFELSHTIYSEITSFLDKNTPRSENKTINPQMAVVNTRPILQNLSSEISAAEHEIASLQAVRTMSHDMAVIKPGSDVVYQASSQADILDRAVEVGEDVVSAAPAAPRWDTES